MGITGTLSGLVIHTAPLSYREECLVAAGGPGMNLVLLLLGLGISPLLTLVNGILLCYNLLPFYPLDGGRILRGCLRLWFPLPLGDAIEAIIGYLAFGTICVVGFYLSFALQCGLWPILFCGFLLYRVGDVIFPRKKTFP